MNAWWSGVSEPDLTKIRAVLLDLDGTVYRGSQVIPGAADAVHQMVKAGLEVRYLTNNSAARPEEISQKLNAMGIPCEPGWVAGTGPAAAKKAEQLGYSSALVVGEPGLKQTFAEAGFDLVHPDDASLLVSGICRTFDYKMLDSALQVLLKGAFWIATNRDGSYPLEGGRLQPGSGAIVAAIEAAVGRSPDLVVGKPEPLMIHQIVQDLDLSLDQVIMVGDREDTDLDAGRNAGCPTWLVLTGFQQQPIPGQAGSPDLLGLAAALLL